MQEAGGGMTGVMRKLAALSAPAAAVLLTAAAPATAPTAPPAPAPEVIRAVTALRAIASMRADFTQTSANGQRLSGVLTLKRPGRIRFQYGAGTPMLIVSDGRALTMFDRAVNQYQRWPIANSPLGALLDPGRDVARYGSLQPMLDPAAIGVAVRDPAHPEFGTLTLVFSRKSSAPGGLQLDGWVTLDSQNQRTVIRLANQQYGIAASDDLFRIRDPHAGPHH